jgi:hypothetical protein
MSHDDFIFAYTNGRVGCSVSTLLTLRLFLVGRIRERRVVIGLVGWSLGLFIVIGLTVIGFVCLPGLWALLSTIVLLAIFALGFIYQVGALIVSIALIDARFYEFALASRTLFVSTDGEGNMAGATESIIRLVVDPGQRRAEVRLESLLEQLEIPPKATERSQVEGCSRGSSAFRASRCDSKQPNTCGCWPMAKEDTGFELVICEDATAPNIKAQDKLRLLN